MIEMGARWHDSSIGRWLSADTIVPNPANPQSLNRYAYAYNNPLRYVDPSGHYPSGRVHYVLTWNAVYVAVHDEATQRGYSHQSASLVAKMTAGLAAQADKDIDWLLPKPNHSMWAGTQHWYSYHEATGAVDAAVEAADPQAFGEALHGLQDYYSHFGGYGFTAEVLGAGLQSYDSRRALDPAVSRTGVAFDDDCPFTDDQKSVASLLYGHAFVPVGNDTYDPDDPWDELMAGDTALAARQFAPAYLDHLGWYGPRYVPSWGQDSVGRGDCLEQLGKADAQWALRALSSWHLCHCGLGLGALWRTRPSRKSARCGG